MIGIQMGEDSGPQTEFEYLETIKKLNRQVNRLRKRLLKKIKFEQGYLINTGADPKEFEKIRKKDEAALRED